jgi:hypothetical protein
MEEIDPMKRMLVVMLFAGLVLQTGMACARDNTLSSEEKAAGWQLLFDGETFANWNLSGREAAWKIEDGTIATVPGQDGWYLATEKQYGNFVLSVDFKLTKDANSGVFFRWGTFDDPVGTGIEAQILDSYGREAGRNDCASVYDCLAPIRNMSKPIGEWERMQIACIDNMVVISLNGVPVTMMDLDLWAEPGKNPDGTGNKFGTAYKDMPRFGYIGLQHHGYQLWFKNIKILPLDPPGPADVFATPGTPVYPADHPLVRRGQ